MREIEIEARGMVFQALADGPEEGPLVILLHGLPRRSGAITRKPLFANSGIW